MPVNSSNLLAIKNAIKAQLVAEKQTGRIQSVYAIGDSWLNEVSNYPYVSVYASSKTEKIEAVRRKRATMSFVIGCAVESDISLEDAYNRLYILMDDGNGAGLENILRDPTHYTWGNLASFSELTETRYYDDLGSNKNQALTSFVAYAVIKYDVVQILRYDGAIS